MKNVDVLVIGGGAAGLMAAEAALEAGVRVLLVEAKPSLARKVLMAGKSGLNLTKDENLDGFLAHYDREEIRNFVREFPPKRVQSWADALGAACFIGSSGKIFPQAMKASPLLRAWLAKLSEAGLEIRTHWRWVGARPDDLTFDTPTGRQSLTAKTAIFALGGASWPRLGSDGHWVEAFLQMADIAPLRPANFAVNVPWSAHMAPHFGEWLKNIKLTAVNTAQKGELGVTRHGLEGGVIYALGEEICAQNGFTLDLRPQLSIEEIGRAFENKGKTSLANILRKLGLSPAARALFFECSKNRDPADIKALWVNVTGPRPLQEAISTAGGVKFSSLHSDLSLKSDPSIFVAGEMLDGSAPTGGYLLTAAFATGRAAGEAAARRALEWRAKKA